MPCGWVHCDPGGSTRKRGHKAQGSWLARPAVRLPAAVGNDGTARHAADTAVATATHARFPPHPCLSPGSRGWL